MNIDNFIIDYLLSIIYSLLAIPLAIPYWIFSFDRTPLAGKMYDAMTVLLQVGSFVPELNGRQRRRSKQEGIPSYAPQEGTIDRAVYYIIAI